MIVKLTERSKCQFPDCNVKATHIAAGRSYNGKYPVGTYCEAHAEVVEREGHPEYTDACPNCGCRFGVN